VHPEQINHQIDKAIPLGLREVKVTGGEPLLFIDDVLCILEHASDQGLSTRLETNGLIVNDVIVSRLKELGTIITTSLDGSSSKSHDWLRNTMGSFERVLYTIKLLVDSGTRVEVVSCIYKNNVNEVGDIITLCTKLGVSRLKFNFPSKYGRAVQLSMHSHFCPVSQIINIVQHIEREQSSNHKLELDFDIPKALRDNHLARPRCDVLGLLSILPNGRYSLCGIGITHTELTFGMIGQEDVDSVWTKNEILTKIRNTLPFGGRGICNLCTEYTSCYCHCIAYSFSEYGSLNGPHPLCQEAFESGLFPISKLVAV
jgi:radical SAM protein with 4Fe4S-binding SPASM domain